MVKVLVQVDKAVTPTKFKGRTHRTIRKNPGHKCNNITISKRDLQGRSYERATNRKDTANDNCITSQSGEE